MTVFDITFENNGRYANNNIFNNHHYQHNNIIITLKKIYVSFDIRKINIYKTIILILCLKFLRDKTKNIFSEY